MIKINYKEPEEAETREDISRHNIQMCDKFKKADYLELSCISWLKIDSKRNYQDLEELFRHLNLDSYVVAQKVSNIPEELRIGMPNEPTNKENEEKSESTVMETNDKLEFIANITCISKEESMKQLLKHHVDYETNFECLKKTGCLISKNNQVKKEEDDKIENMQGVNEVRKLLDCKLKLELELYRPLDSINYIIKDLTTKYGKEPEKIICGEIGINKVWALMIDGQIVSPIGWTEKLLQKKKIELEFEQENINEANEISDIEYELIDFRSIKMEK